jgi:hypothetical protein
MWIPTGLLSELDDVPGPVSSAPNHHNQNHPLMLQSHMCAALELPVLTGTLHVWVVPMWVAPVGVQHSRVQRGLVMLQLIHQQLPCPL